MPWPNANTDAVDDREARGKVGYRASGMREDVLHVFDPLGNILQVIQLQAELRQIFRRRQWVNGFVMPHASGGELRRLKHEELDRLINGDTDKRLPT